MTRQGNILSFDEAKAHGSSRSDIYSYSRSAYGSRDSSTNSCTSRSNRRRSARTFSSEGKENARSSMSMTSSRSVLVSSRAQRNKAPSTKSSLSTEFPARQSGQRGVPLQGQHFRSEQKRSVSGDRQVSCSSEMRQGQTSRRSQRLRSVDRSSMLKEAQREDYLADREKHISDGRDQSHVEKKRKKTLSQRLRGIKATRAYNKVFGSGDAPKTESSRAALYEMKMGRTHRRSSRMQDDSNNKHESSSKSFSPLAIIGSFASSQKATRIFLCVCGVVFACIMLYGPCASYYTEVRSVQQLEAEYQALQDYNQDMQSQIDYLNTEEGMEEYIRSELGWIRADEHMMQVEGLDAMQPSTTDSSSASGALTTVPSESIKAPTTWYSGVLDVFFGYQG